MGVKNINFGLFTGPSILNSAAKPLLKNKLSLLHFHHRYGVRLLGAANNMPS